VTIAFAGEQGAFAELAAREYFGPRGKVFPVPEFGDVFREVAAGRCAFGVVPIENSLSGSIHQNYDHLLESNLVIVGEVLLRVRQFLIANKGTRRKDLVRLFSHPAVFPQCRKFLNKFPHLTAVPASNTAGAVKKIKDENLRDAAAIASMQAAIDFDMQVVARNIEDTKWNTTRFLVIAKKTHALPASVKKTKSSVVFSMKSKPGALLDCLNVFAKRGINLFKIESRPVRQKARGFAYLFYLDFEGDARKEIHKEALREIQKITTFYRFLGSYATGTPRDPKYRPRTRPYALKKNGL
jgi:prephenate dehydratase